MLRLMAKRKKSELKVGNSLESKKRKKKKGTEEIWSREEVGSREEVRSREEVGSREEVRLMDEQVRLEQLEKRLESKVFNFIALIFYYHQLFPNFYKFLNIYEHFSPLLLSSS